MEHNKRKKKSKNKNKFIDMTLQLRSLLSYMQLLPVQHILPPLNSINTMDLFNLCLSTIIVYVFNFITKTFV